EGRWTEALGGARWGLALAGCSVGWGTAVDCGVCTSGRGALDGGVGGSPLGQILMGCSVGRGVVGSL
ncbi:MAG: hypothetical protein ACLSWS_09755, partial [Faecalispora jeddahensis]